jgi:hypothetical protein
LQVEITFTHTGGSTDWVYVLLDNGTPLRWPWPSYGAELPYDLVHYLVETRLGVRHGFWGLVADGVSFNYLSFAADQVRAGIQPDPPSTGPLDLTELIQVECVAQGLADPGNDAACVYRIRTACERRGVPVPAGLDDVRADKTSAELRADLAELATRWRALAAGRSLVLSYSCD